MATTLACRRHRTGLVHRSPTTLMMRPRAYVRPRTEIRLDWFVDDPWTRTRPSEDIHRPMWPRTVPSTRRDAGPRTRATSGCRVLAPASRARSAIAGSAPSKLPVNPPRRDDLGDASRSRVAFFFCALAPMGVLVTPRLIGVARRITAPRRRRGQISISSLGASSPVGAAMIGEPCHLRPSYSRHARSIAPSRSSASRRT